ncbi:hypothetical protein FACS1894184_06030 [Clostridia bacterium]|nr:hypothetical protein FACS1894184_06030 [Clostridia bacterium]
MGKNVYRSVKAIDGVLSKKEFTDYQVIITGNCPVPIRKLIKRRERYQYLDCVSSNELEGLYRNCDIFVFLSLNEGFGYPPLEAMKYGKTCVISPICSLPEICSDAVYYANPYDIAEIQNRLMMAATTKIECIKIINRAQEIALQQDKHLEQLCNVIVERTQL